MMIDDEADEADVADVGSCKVRLKDAERRLRNLETKGRGDFAMAKNREDNITHSNVFHS